MSLSTSRRLFATFALLALLALFSAPGLVLAQSDVSMPGDVERLTAEAGNGAVHLQWDVATDDTAVTGYKVYFGTDSVSNKNNNKYSNVVDAKDVIDFTVSGLKNDTTYYFAVTAYDAAGNESENYSPEVNAKPTASLMTASVLSEFGTSKTAVSEKSEKGDPEEASEVAASAPTVVSAEATDKNQVKVVFSQKIALPLKNAETAFVIQDNLTLENLKVIAAQLDEKDTEGKTVLLTTELQIPETEYVLTAGTEIENETGNAVLSGNSDSVIFQGVSGPVAEGSEKGGPADAEKIEKMETPDKPAAPEEQGFGLEKIESASDTIIVLTFNEEVILSLDPLENFMIYEKDNEEKKLPITAVNVNDAGTIVTLTTGLQSNVTYTLVLSGVSNTKSENISEDKTTFDFQGKGESVSDTTPPEDATQFLAKVLRDLKVRLNWKGSANSAGDLLEYILYSSGDGANYGKILSLGKDAIQYDVTGLTPGEHFFKLTAKDSSGNESSGAVTKVRLVETGPGLGLIGLASVGLGRLFRRKKK